MLYQARVHPESSASALDAEAVRRLHKAIVDVLALAEDSGCTRAW